MPSTSRHRALITGGSAGLGRALAAGLADDDWEVVITGRDPRRLDDAAAELGPRVKTVVGDVTDPGHRAHLAEVVADGLDLLVNNASTLGWSGVGTSPLVPVQALTSAVLRHVWETNVVAPVALIRTLRPLLREDAAVIDITSDAAVEHYETWGAYAASKAALEHLTLTLAAEDPGVRWYAVDPGDLRTQMQQDAFPDQDISDRPLPETVIPAFLALIGRRPPSGRYRAAEISAVAA